MTTMIQFEIWFWAGYPYNFINYNHEQDTVQLWIDKQSYDTQDKFEELKNHLFSL